MLDKAKWPWSVLNLAERPQDPREIRRAYARLLKQRNWSGDVAGFERLRNAYEHALRLVGEGQIRHRVVLPDIHETHPSEPVSQEPHTGHPVQSREAPPLPSGDNAGQPAEDEHAIDDAEAFWQRLEAHLNSPKLGPAHVDELRLLLQSPALEDPDMRWRTEEHLIRHIGQKGPSDYWTEAADERFGWRRDGVGFRRRFPWAQTVHQKILDATGYLGTPSNDKAEPQGKLNQLLALFPFLLPVPLVASLVLSSVDSKGLKNTSMILATVAFSGLGAMLALMLLKSVSVGVIFPLLRLPAWSERMLIATQRWWRRPIWRLDKSRLALVVVMVLAMVGGSVFTAYRLSLRGPVLSDVVRESHLLYTSLDLSEDADIGAPLNPELAVLPRFVIPHAGKSDPDDPYDIVGSVQTSSMTITFAAPPKTRPRAILRCLTPGSCQLAVSQRLTALGQINARSGVPISGQLFSPIMRLENSGPRSVHVSLSGWDGQFDYLNRVALNVSSSKTDYQFLSVRMSEPVATYTGGTKFIKMPEGIDLPIGLLDGHIGLRFEWPADQPPAASCRSSERGDLPLAECGFVPEDFVKRMIWICPLDSDASFCTSATVNADQITEFIPYLQPVTEPWVSEPKDAASALLQELLRRMAVGGVHPPLPDTPDMHALHQQVLRDYALILDRPRAAADRDNDDALHAALARQPQLFRATNAEPEVRQLIWDGFLKWLSALGFPSARSENAGTKLGHGSGGIGLLRKA